MLTRLFAVAIACAIAASPALAQATKTQPPTKGQPTSPSVDPDQPTSEKPGKPDKARKPADPGSTVGPTNSGYPKIIDKELHAKNDFRGKKAPLVSAEKWLTERPNHKGKVVLVDFWATWCPACRDLIPELQNFQATFGDDLVIIGISEEDRETVANFATARKITYPLGLDAKSRMKKIIGVTGIPHVLIISSDGFVRWQGFPYTSEDPLNEAVIRQIITADKAAKAEKEAKKKPGKIGPTEMPYTPPESPKDGEK